MSSCGWLRHRPGGVGLRPERAGVTGPWGRRLRGTRGPARSREQLWGAKECAQIGENDLSVSFWGTCVHCCDARVARVAMRAAPGGTSAPTTMECRRRPLGGRLSPGRENRSCASGAAASLASSPRRQPTQTPEGFFQCGCVNPILIRRGNTLFPRQPIRRTWGQLGEQLDRVVGAAGFVHRRKSKEATVSE